MSLKFSRNLAFSDSERGALPEDLIRSLSAGIREALLPLIPPGSACALLGFPDHPNVGDSAIWLGEQAYLQGIEAKIVYESDPAIFSQRYLSKRLRDGIILIHGGGNLGDLWPRHQRFREDVVRAFPDKRIIQLPQTIYFKERVNLKRARDVFNSHSALTLLVRDRTSLELARNEFQAASFLCPDMAFALGPLRRPSGPAVKVLWLSRTDMESKWRGPTATDADVQCTDWLHEAPSLIGGLNDLLTRQIGNYPRRLERLSAVTSRFYRLLARQRVARGSRILSRGEVVITDRLHGHILSVLMGIPHVILDNSYGKLQSFYETWTRDWPSAVWAGSQGQALECAKKILG